MIKSAKETKIKKNKMKKKYGTKRKKSSKEPTHTVLQEENLEEVISSVQVNSLVSNENMEKFLKWKKSFPASKADIKGKLEDYQLDITYTGYIDEIANIKVLLELAGNDDDDLVPYINRTSVLCDEVEKESKEEVTAQEILIPQSKVETKNIITDEKPEEMVIEIL